MSDKSRKEKKLGEEVRELRKKVLEFQNIDIIRKQAEKKSLESDRQYRTLFENAIDAILIIDQESDKIIDCNNKAADMSGYTVRELLTMTVTELCPPEEQDIVSKIFRKVASRGSLSGISGIRLLRKDGTSVPVEINAAVHEVGARKCICGMIRDITHRKKTEDMLRESEAKSRAMLDTALDAIIMMDGKGTISYFNKAAEKMFGFKQKEVKGKRLHDILVSEKARRKYHQFLPKFELSGQCQIIGKTLELSASKKDGTRFPVEISVSSFCIQDKWHSVASIRDITVRKEIESKLRESSVTDDLTGLINRRGFFDLSLRQLKLANRSKSGFYLLLLKVDNLKSINTKHGQITGDRLLQETAKMLKSIFRESDMITRTGGDEFSVVFIAPPEPDIERVIGSHFEGMPGTFLKQKINGDELSFSMAISYYDPGLPCSLDELILRTEARMNKNRRLRPAAVQKPAEEKRQYERYSIGRRVKGEFDIPGEVFIRNISLGGICLKTTRMLSPDTSHKISLEGPFNRKTSMTGRVVWSVEGASGRKRNLPAFESGLQFSDVNNSIKKSLQKVIARLIDS